MLWLHRFVSIVTLLAFSAPLLIEPAVEGYQAVDKQLRLMAFEAFLTSHPFAKVDRSRSEERPRPEDPGERHKQEYLLMVDPHLGRVPTERLAIANRAARAMRLSPQAPIQGAAAATQVWEERGPNNVGGRTRAIMFDPNDAQHEKVWAGGVGGGLWYTDDITDENESWHNVDDFWANLAVTSMAYDPTNTMVFYVGTGEGYFNIDALQGGGLFKSTDGGATWDQLLSTTGVTWTQVQDVVVTDQGTVLAATRDGGGVQRSDDGGASWTTVLYPGTGASTSRAADLEVAANGDIYAAMGLFSTDGVWKSDDDGVTWDKLNTGGNGFPTSGFHRIEIATAPSDANRVYAVTQESASFGVGGFYQTTDGGATWASLPLPIDAQSSFGSDFTRGQAWYDLTLAVKPDDENVLVAGGIDLFRGDSVGSAFEWEQLSHWYGGFGYPNVHADQHAIVFRPGSPTAAAFGNDGGVYYTADVTDDPPVWVVRNKGYNVTQYYSVAQSPTGGSNLIVGGTQDNGTPKIDGDGVSAQVADVTSGDGAFTHINQATNILGMASNQRLAWHRSLDGGSTFSYIGGISGGGSFINPSDLDEDPDHLFFNYSNSAVGRLNNLTGGGGVTYLTFGPGGGFGSIVTHVRNSEFSPAATSTIYLGTSAGRIFRAANAHSPPPGPPISPSWSELDTGPFPTGSISCIELGAGEDTLLVTFSNYGVSSVWYTMDGGANWDDLDAGSNLPDIPVWWALLDPFDANRVYIGTEAGLWFTDDIAANPVVWNNDPGVPLTRVVTIKYRTSDHQVVVATHGRGIWTTELTAPPPPPAPPALVAHLFLEGAYAGGGSMTVSSNFESARPMSQPYDDAAFDGTPSEYDGSESVGGFPTGTIDWILVELRTGLTAASEVPNSRRPAFVLQDGLVVGLDGDTLRFPEIASDSYYVVFRHRNHLAIITDSAIDFTTGPGEIDFRTSLAAAHSQGGVPMKGLGGGYYGMFAADGAVDGVITAPDFNAWIAATSAGLAGYVLEDFDLDSLVTATDFNMWNANTTSGAASQVDD